MCVIYLVVSRAYRFFPFDTAAAAEGALHNVYANVHAGILIIASAMTVAASTLASPSPFDASVCEIVARIDAQMEFCIDAMRTPTIAAMDGTAAHHMVAATSGTSGPFRRDSARARDTHAAIPTASARLVELLAAVSICVTSNPGDMAALMDGKKDKSALPNAQPAPTAMTFSV